MGRLNAPAVAVNEHWVRNAAAIAEAADMLAVAAKEFARSVEFNDQADAEEEQRLARAFDELRFEMFPNERLAVAADEWRKAHAEARADAAAEAGW